ncbi:uncharacterized protein LOC108911520 [Anoplophora glabripennis]|uniref:uncharacterized protein LOC108911520 n=1 Tax=Anoplophora glabripennis TaxID=217634 RepID=UPI00087438D0|nr:uncharacterized protein LOC108911520 [Anoplophora glabripennis]
MNLDNTNCSDFEELLKNYINKLDEIIVKLNDLLKTIADHHQSCNIAKTASTAFSSTGVAILVGSVLLSPFTGGSSLALGTSGAVMSITGGISNVVVDYVDYKTSTMIMNDIQLIIKSKEEFEENLRTQLRNFVMVIEKLMESGLDKYSATVIAIKGIASGCIDLTTEPNMKLMTTLSTIIKMHHVEAVALDTLPVIGKTIHISEKTYQFITRIFGLPGHSAAFFKLVGRVSSAISVAFTIVDITLLIKDWMTEHPTVEVVSETIKQLQEEKHILSDFLEIIDASRDKVEIVLQEVIKDIEKEIQDSDIENDFVFVPNEIESF